MARRIHNVDLDALKKKCRVLGKNRDAALALEIVRVHDTLHHGLVGAEDAALVQHGVDESGLPMVNVGYDGDVANLLGQEYSSRQLPCEPEDG